MIDYYSYSERGERSVNQDSVGEYIGEDICVFTLCDGLGGHGGGEIASKTAVDAFLKTAKVCGGDDDFFSQCLEAADENLLRIIQSDSSLKNMKTTATLLLLKEGKAQWAHIGDSRIYYFKKNKYIARTLDHSIPQTLVATGQIKESEIRHHIDRNKLLRCLPSEGKSFEISGEPVEISKGDSFFMMSDGFWDWIDSKDLKKSLKKNKTAKDCVNSLVETAFKRGKGSNMDNLSMILVRID